MRILLSGIFLCCFFLTSCTQAVDTSNLESKIAKLESRINQMQSTIDKLQNETDNLSAQVNSLSSSDTDIKTAIKGDLTTLYKANDLTIKEMGYMQWDICNLAGNPKGRYDWVMSVYGPDDRPPSWGGGHFP
jgi:FtsZ-binding cell division protein ZapB